MPRPLLSPYGWTMLGLAAMTLVAVVATRAYRLPAALPPALSAEASGGLFAAMLLLGMLGATAGSLVAGVADGGPATLRESAIVTLGAYAAQAVAVLAYALLLRRAARRLGGAGVSPPVAVAVGVAVLVVAWPFVVCTAELGAALQQALLGQPIDPLAHRTLQMLHAERGGPWPIVVSGLAVVVAPVFEEVLYRGLGQGALRAVGAGPWVAIVLVSAFFALMHATAVPPAALAALFVLSLALGWARERTGGLLAPIVAHVGFNAANLWLAAGAR